MVGGQAGFAGHIHVADRTNVGAQCGVISNTKGNGEALLGSPAMDPRTYFKGMAMLRRLPDMQKELMALRKELEELKKTK
jgi:UDP-3-O-[3-hydroxymyristoyl] glucosamine N-acyltransferase